MVAALCVSWVCPKGFLKNLHKKPIKLWMSFICILVVFKLRRESVINVTLGTRPTEVDCVIAVTMFSKFKYVHKNMCFCLLGWHAEKVLVFSNFYPDKLLQLYNLLQGIWWKRYVNLSYCRTVGLEDNMSYNRALGDSAPFVYLSSVVKICHVNLTWAGLGWCPMVLNVAMVI